MTAVATVWVRPIPRTDPPVIQLLPDDWRQRPGASSAPSFVQGTLAVDFDRSCEDTYFGPQATAACDLPEPGPWARAMIRASLEVIDGARPAHQLSRWTTPEVHDRLARRGLLSRRRRTHPCHPNTVRALLTCEPTDGVVEVSAVVAHGGRVRALAVRMVGVDHRWLITVFDLG